MGKSIEIRNKPVFPNSSKLDLEEKRISLTLYPFPLPFSKTLTPGNQRNQIRVPHPLHPATFVSDPFLANLHSTNSQQKGREEKRKKMSLLRSLAHRPLVSSVVISLPLVGYLAAFPPRVGVSPRRGVSGAQSAPGSGAGSGSETALSGAGVVKRS